MLCDQAKNDTDLKFNTPGPGYLKTLFFRKSDSEASSFEKLKGQKIFPHIHDCLVEVKFILDWGKNHNYYNSMDECKN